MVKMELVMKDDVKFIQVNNDITFFELKRRLITKLQLANEAEDIKITYRYPQVMISPHVNYIPMPINDDEDVEIMLSLLQSTPMLNAAELYVEVEPLTVGVMQSPRVERIAQSLPETLTPVEECGPSTQVDNIPYVPSEDIDDIEFSERLVMNDDYDMDEEEDDDYDVEEEEEEEESNELDCWGDMPDADNRQTVPILQVPSQSFLENTWDDIHDLSYDGERCITNWDESQEFQKSLQFSDKQEVQHAIMLYSLKHNQAYKVKESNKTKLHVCCINLCGWRVRACKRSKHDLWEITKYNGSHTCTHDTFTPNSTVLDLKFIEREVRHLVQGDHSIKIKALQKEIKHLHKNYDASYYKVWDARRKAIVHLFGDWDESYYLLPKFMAALTESNPSSKVEWKTLNTGVIGSAYFHHVFWAFGPSIEGFKHCRPVISIDATFLYGKYKGKLMIAMAQDANNSVYPLAFAVVEEESQSSWYWFLDCIKKHVTTLEEICIISDRHTGIMSAIDAILATDDEDDDSLRPPNLYHRFCIRHVASNFNERYYDKQLKNMIKKAGGVNQLRKFNTIMEAIRKLNPSARKRLDDIPREKWTLAHDDGRRYGATTTNLVECFNGVLKGARNLPITAMMKFIFFKLMKYFNDRRNNIRANLEEGQVYSKHAMDIFEKYAEKSLLHIVTEVTREDGTFSVWTPMNPNSINRGNHIQIVKLLDRTCSCGKWQLYKIPCSHVIASCRAISLNAHQFIDPC
jgi:hypothetical protein